MNINGLITAKKSTGLGDLFKDYAPQQLEEHRPQQTPSSIINAVLEKYLKALSYSGPLEARTCFSKHLTEVLSPIDIHSFWQSTLAFEEQKQHRRTGEFITQLMQNSYDAGYSQFAIDTRNFSRAPWLLGYHLQGSPQRPLHLTVLGDVGMQFAQSAKYGYFFVSGNVDVNCGVKIQNSVVSIGGSAGIWCFEEAADSLLYVGQSVDEGCGKKGKNIRCFIGEDANDRLGYQCVNSLYVVRRDVKDYLGLCSRDSYYFIGGKTGDYCATVRGYDEGINRTTNCSFYFGDDVGIMCADNAEKCRFVFLKGVGTECGIQANGSQFKTFNQNTLKILLREAHRDNPIYWCHDGTEERKR